MSFCVDDIASLHSVELKAQDENVNSNKEQLKKIPNSKQEGNRQLTRSINSNKSNRSNGSMKPPKDYQYSEEPIQLIDFSKGFKINPKALDLLNSIKDDIIVVSVVGKARTGKSYLMNLLLDLIGKNDLGFKVASTLSSCTKGIWLWNNMRTSINSNAKILFLDSEGTSSTDKSTKTYDSRIFALVVLISSLFLYNTYSNIDEHGISELSLAAHLSGAITTNSDINKDELLTELSPKFIWIVRDFTLEKVHPETGEEITSKEYLELCLKNKRCGKNANDNNLIRQNIIKYFPQRDCVTLVRPVNSESDLKKLNNIPFDKLKPDFKMEFKKLKDKIFKEATPKKYNGRRLNGPGLACLVEEFVKTINSGKIPNINNSWDTIIEKDINDSYSKAVSNYKSKIAKLNISSNNVYNSNDLLRKMYSFQYESMQIFNSILISNSDTMNYKNYNKMYHDAKKNLTNEMNKIHKKTIDQNSSNSRKNCSNCLIGLAHQMEDKFYKNEYNIKNQKEISEDFENLLNEYGEKGKGDKKLKELCNFLISKEKPLVEYLVSMMNKDNEKNMRKIDNNLKLAKAEIDDAENKRRVIDTKGKYNQDKISSLVNENKQLDDEIVELKETLEEKKKQLKELQNAKKTNEEMNETSSVTSSKKKKRREEKEKHKREGCACQCSIY